MGKVGFVYTEEYNNYNFGEGHPLTPLRIELTYSLMKAYHLFENPNIELLHPRIATEEEVLKVHDPNYLNKLKELNNIEKASYQAFPEFGLGPGDNPIFPHMYDAAMEVCGASITAADYILQDENKRAHNIIGGLHHAMPEMASGFCLLNDVAVSIEYIKAHNPDSKIMYIDIDCHHGDGVQWIYYERPDVLTLSFHQDGKTIFPGSGFLKEKGKNAGVGYSLNVPIPPGTTDSVYLELVRKIVPNVMDAYHPDYVVLQTGVDTHFADPLTQMGLSTTGQEKVFRYIYEAVPKSSGDKMLVLGGGGYNINVVARSWSLFLAEMLDTNLNNDLPPEWLDELNSKWTEEPPPDVLRDQNYYIQQLLLKDPYFIDEIEMVTDKIIQIYEDDIIPSLKSKT